MHQRETILDASSGRWASRPSEVEYDRYQNLFRMRGPAGNGSKGYSPASGQLNSGLSLNVEGYLTEELRKARAHCCGIL
jgi:hypothetical protein